MKLISLRLYMYKHLVIWIIISYYVHLVTRVSRINSKDKFLSKFRHNCCSFDFKISMRGKILRVNITVLIFLRKFSFSKKLYLTNIYIKYISLLIDFLFKRKEFLACQKVATTSQARGFIVFPHHASGSYIFPTSIVH